MIKAAVNDGAATASRTKNPLSETAFGVVDTIPDDPSTTVTIAPGGTINAWVSPEDDLDFVRLDVVQGRTYLISQRAAGDTPMADPLLFLYTNTGAVARFDDDGGNGINSLITFTAAYTGTYYIEAGSWGGGDTGQYALDVRQMGSDSVGATNATSVALALGTTFGFTETSGDVDRYAVTLEAGQFYTFEVAGGADYNSNYLSLPAGELDTRLRLRDSSGNLLVENDDIDFPSDISSAFGFTAKTSGTYYLDVAPYSGRTGGYTIDFKQVDFDGLNVLDSIDWGTKLPDNNVTVYFVKAGETMGGETSLGWNQVEQTAALNALKVYQNVLNITVTVVDDPSKADFKLITVNSDSYLGRFIPPGENGAGFGYFARNGTGWTEEVASGGGLQQGGYGFITLVHEFGHGFGLAHPHDTGGTSEVIPGVFGPFGSYGAYELNQGIYTTMSYNDGWQLNPDAVNGNPVPATVSWGWQGTLGALDVALLQQKYGANTSFNAGANTYALPTANVAGTYWATIWDTGGVDEIVQNGTRDATIDLNAATIDYSFSGGGLISYADGIFGGFTIAQGVVIENARGGSGNDTLIGNAVANVLTGNAGDDWLSGGAGGDTLNGGAGFDIASYQSASAGVIASLGSPGGTGGEAAGDKFSGIEALEGSNFADRFTGGNGDDTLWGMGGDDYLEGGNGLDMLWGGDGADTLIGANGNDTLMGEGGNDTLDGSNGNDVLNGGAGNDVLTGSLGDDIYAFTDLGGTDRIVDFKRGADRIDLSDLDAVTGGPLNAFSWIGGAAFSGTAGQLRSYSEGGSFWLAGDVNGDSVADFLIQTNIQIVQTDLILA
jgi:serralysin